MDKTDKKPRIIRDKITVLGAVFVALFLIGLIISFIKFTSHTSNNISSVSQNQDISTTPSDAVSESPSQVLNPPSTETMPTTSTTELTGYGATQLYWDENHTQAPNKSPETVYDPLPNGNDKFGDVEWQNGRLVGFWMDVESPVALNTAKTIALTYLPSDTKEVYDRKMAACEMVQYYSEALNTILGSGYVDVGFSNSKSPDNYDSSNIDWLIFTSGSLGDQEGC